MPYKDINKRREWYRKWYAKNGRNRAIDYFEAILEWKENNPEKVKAHILLNKAIKEGTIIKPTHCQQCNQERKLSAHHTDYSKPLKVLWLCYSCHKTKHNKYPIDK